VKVLLIDDDNTLREVLADYLTAKCIEVKTAGSGVEALEILKRETFDAIVLDVMMPQMDGLEVLQKIQREHGLLPVIMLTAVGDEPDRILGLELGADDYLVKPVSPRELLAHIKALHRRNEKTSSKDAHAEILEINREKREVFLRGSPLDLTSVEFTILSILHLNRGIVLERERLMDLARGKEFIACDRSIDVHISHLRQKLGDDPRNPRIIKTIRGTGYLFAGL
jgi:two-component system, OmpR family, phosphate regulon response regulator OmpR